MKTRRPLFVLISLMAALTAAAVADKSPVTGAEGKNAEYARLANGVVPAVTRIAGRSFSGRVEIKSVAQPDMQAVLAEDIAMVRAWALNAQDVLSRSEALSVATPVYYSVARRRIYFSPDAVRQRMKDGRLNPRWESEALRLLLAFELVRFLDDQQVDLKKLLSNAVSVEQARAYRAITAGHARLVVEKIAAEWSRPGLGQLVARWALGEGASQGLEKRTGLAIDEEFSFCFDGGYRFAAYMYESWGADGFYRTYSNPPVSASVLFNPIQYKIDASTVASEKPAVKPVGSESATEYEVLSVLLEGKNYLPKGEWEAETENYEEFLKSLDSQKERAEYEGLFSEWSDVFFSNEKAVVFLSGGSARTEVPEEFIQGMVLDIEKTLEELASKTQGTSSFGDPISLAGLGYGSGWLKTGELNPGDGKRPVSCWLAACRSGQIFLYGFGMNCPMTQKEITAMFTAMLAKLQ